MPKRPNFLIIVADDLGYSDIAPFGGEIQTPTLDRLAKEGIRLTNFHTASACSPTRSMLMSGTDNHIAGLGQMAESMRAKREQFDGKAGYEGYLNWRVAALPEILQDAGYRTMMSGKWHLGLKKELSPSARGFDKVHAFLPGAGNHYNFEPQDGESFPMKEISGKGNWWMKDDRFIDRHTLPSDFYSTTNFTDNLLGFLKEHLEKNDDSPFFAYLPYTAPHWPLQAPRDVIEKYKGVYDEGPEKLRESRLQRLKELGMVAESVESAPWTGQFEEPWDKRSPEAKAASSRKMEAFAAMVDIVDQNITRVVEHLESVGELDNTFILFMSDNGAEGTQLEALPVMGGNLLDIIGNFYDNSYENIGNSNSFTWYGPRWASAAMAPSRGFKSWITEGGIRCPCIVRYPKFTTETGAITNTFTTVMDILPTILELAEVQPPGSVFRGREVVPVRGKSWVSHLSSQNLFETSVHDKETTITGWELFGARAIRQGQYKAIWLPTPRGKEDWELYNIDEDPAEVNDLAEKEPAILKRMISHWESYFTETGMLDAHSILGFHRP